MGTPDRQPDNGNPNDILIILDTETTGLNHKTDKLIEIGAVRLINGEIDDTFSALINPEIPIRHSSFKIHGISDEMVADKPTIDAVLPDFLVFMGDAPYAAHNAIFDYSFINQATKTVLNQRFSNRRIDSLQMYRSVFPDEPSHGLSALLERFGEESTVNHRALDDAMGLAKVFLRLRALYEQKYAWQLSQLENVPYLVERYLRIQRALQLLQSEMSDLKEVFKLHFSEGGEPITATTGEVLISSYRRSYDFDEDRLYEILTAAGQLKKASKLNLRALEKMLENGKLNDIQREEIEAARLSMSESVNVAFIKPQPAAVTADDDETSDEGTP